MAAGSPSWQPQRPRRLADDGGLLARGGRPEARITEPTLRAYIGHLRAGCASTSVASAIGILGMAIQAMAPEPDWSWLWRAQSRLQGLAHPSRDKCARIVPVEELLHLGQDLMARADSAATPLAAALVFRDGLMIALLALRPLRRKNFIAIDLEVPFPATPLPALARYLDHLRPVLRAQRTTRGASRQGIAAPTNALWLTQYGVPFSANADGAALRTPLSPTPSPDYPGFPASTC